MHIISYITLQSIPEAREPTIPHFSTSSPTIAFNLRVIALYHPEILALSTLAAIITIFLMFMSISDLGDRLGY